jgi:hypothetical protein
MPRLVVEEVATVLPWNSRKWRHRTSRQWFLRTLASRKHLLQWPAYENVALRLAISMPDGKQDTPNASCSACHFRPDNSRVICLDRARRLIKFECGIVILNHWTALDLCGRVWRLTTYGLWDKKVIMNDDWVKAVETVVVCCKFPPR